MAKKLLALSPVFLMVFLAACSSAPGETLSPTEPSRPFPGYGRVSVHPRPGSQGGGPGGIRPGRRARPRGHRPLRRQVL